MTAPWAYIAHKGGYWAGVASASYEGDLDAFLGSLVRDGFNITVVFSREEYNAFIGPMECWSSSPKAPPGAAEPDLFGVAP